MLRTKAKPKWVLFLTIFHLKLLICKWLSLWYPIITQIHGPQHTPPVNLQQFSYQIFMFDLDPSFVRSWQKNIFQGCQISTQNVYFYSVPIEHSLIMISKKFPRITVKNSEIPGNQKPLSLMCEKKFKS